MRFNPDAFSPGVRHVEDDSDGGASIEKQRQLIKDASAFLLTVQIPTLVSYYYFFFFFFFQII